MLLSRGIKHTKAPSYSLRTSRFIDRDFQLKYTSVVLTAALIGILVTIFPIYYFLSQNYNIFVDLAYEQAPQILHYLERERSWVNILLIAGCTGTLCFFWYLSLKLTSRIVGPIQVLKNHIRGLSRGQWAQAPIRIRDSDEFQDLIDSYNYFYDSFRVNLQRDLELLKKFSIDPKNRDAYLAWRSLIEEKAYQLGRRDLLPEPEIIPLSVDGPSEESDQRHVS
ncbi:MAG: hypothetical protein KDD34_02210 [Bdellovibrionales bacterium]|nr:hypothetical protein [Bdellovibrionales bacterium]